jgi:methyl-accepting chemotaxis protein
VRNLAAKSADAAKETGNLIYNSMEKAELGAAIAGETAVSLTEIVTGINESSRIVGEIAHSSEEQSAGIIQINKGIDQVAQVVQQNSATAEESAASAQEMSSQSAILEELVAQFKLAGGSGVPALTGKSTSPSRSAPKKRLEMPSKTSFETNSGDFGKY